MGEEMKKIILVVALFLAFAGVAVGSSLNGDYKGNPIVLVKSDGKQLETDEVPAMIYDGHTVVPISLLRQIGASVTWDANTYSVDVTLKNQQQSSSSDVLKLKNYNKVADDYRKLMIVGDSISEIGTYTIATVDMMSVSNSNSTKNYIQLSENQINNANDLMSKVSSTISEIYVDFESAGIDPSAFKSIYSSYLNSLTYYRNALNDVEGLFRNADQTDYNNYESDVKNAMNSLSMGRSQNTQKYFDIFNVIQNF